MFGWLERIIRWVLIVLVASMTLIVSASVVCRYVFNVPLPWAEEVTRYMFIYTIFLGGAVGVRRSIHVKLDLWRRDSRTGQVMEWVARLLVTAFLIFLTYYGFVLAGSALEQRSPALGIPIGLAYLAIPLGAVLALVFVWGPKARQIEGQAA